MASAAAAAGGLTYDQEGGIVLPDGNGPPPVPRQKQAANTGGGGGGGVSYDENGGIILNPSGQKQQDKDIHAGGVDYDSEGGIILHIVPPDGNLLSRLQGLALAPMNGTTTNTTTTTTEKSKEKESFLGRAILYDFHPRTPSCGKKYENTDLVALVNSKQFKHDDCGKQLHLLGSFGDTVNVTVAGKCDGCGERKFDLTTSSSASLSHVTDSTWL